MSFHWNLSDDDDDGDNDVDDDTTSNNHDVNQNPKTIQKSFVVTSFGSSTTSSSGEHVVSNGASTIVQHPQHEQKDWNWNGDIFPNEEENNSNNNDTDGVDWEDADNSVVDDDKDDDDRKPAAVVAACTDSSCYNNMPNNNTSTITIDLDQSTVPPVPVVTTNDGGVISKKRTATAKRRRNVFRIESLPHRLQSQLQHLHRTHLLALTSHVVYLSHCICNTTNNTSNSNSTNNLNNNNNNDHNDHNLPDLILALAHSLIPEEYLSMTIAKQPQPTIYSDNYNNKNASSSLSSSSSASSTYPTLSQMRQFVNEWYIPLVHDVDVRRRQQQYNNRMAGAPQVPIHRRRHRRRRTTTTTTTGSQNNDTSTNHNHIHINHDTNQGDNNTSGRIEISHDPILLLPTYMSYLSKTTEDDPQLWIDASMSSSSSSSSESLLLPFLRQQRHPSTNTTRDQLQTLLLLAMVRSMGWRARLVGAIQPMSLDLTVDHPILTSFCTTSRNIVTSIRQPQVATTTSKKSKTRKRQRPDNMVGANCDDTNSAIGTDNDAIRMMWVEILCHDNNIDDRHSSNNQNNNTEKKKKKKNQYRWYHVDPSHKLINQPDSVELLLGQQQQQHPRTAAVLAYAISVEHTPVIEEDGCDGVSRFRVTDVSPRYAKSWIATLRHRGMIRSKKCSMEAVVRTSWWTKTVHIINTTNRPTSMPLLRSNGTVNDPIRLDGMNDSDGRTKSHITTSTTELMGPSLMDDDMDQVDDHENDELIQSANNEALPTSKAEFKIHPLYALSSELGKTEVLHPDAKQRVCGVFKGQLVYRRSDVSTMHSLKKWMYVGRMVRNTEVSKPIKLQTKRKKPLPTTKGFKALRSYGVGATNDGNEERQMELGSIPLEDDTEEKLYGIWQTDEWTPDYVGPTDEIPTNEFKNIELALLNPGLIHIDQTGLAGVAKKLGIPYAPCLLGFEGQGGNRTPTIRGIVVHVHNEQLIREAGVEVQSYEVEKGCNDRRRSILLLWKRLMVGLLTKDRLEREYGNDDE